MKPLASCFLGLFIFCAGLAVGNSINKERIEQVRAQRDAAVNALRAPLSTSQPDVRFLNKELKGDACVMVTDSTEWILVHRETGKQDSRLDGTKEVEPLISLEKANAPGVLFFLRVNFPKGKVLEIPKHN